LRAKRLWSGFSLIELMIVVAVIAIIAAIALPVLFRARVSANESAIIGDIRTVLSAQGTYSSANGGAYDGALSCLGQPSACIPGYPAGGPAFVDAMIASGVSKVGYARNLASGPPPVGFDPASQSPTSVRAYVYWGRPIDPGRTGVRAFAGDATGIICASANGVQPPFDAEFRLNTASPDCSVLK
jgi:prepilin-type N-terminal cleavage/methylation domain-containing protein